MDLILTQMSIRIKIPEVMFCGRPDEGAAPPRDEPHPRKGHEAGGAAEEGPLALRAAISEELEAAPGYAGHRADAAEDCDFR